MHGKESDSELGRPGFSEDGTSMLETSQEDEPEN